MKVLESGSGKGMPSRGSSLYKGMGCVGEKEYAERIAGVKNVCIPPSQIHMLKL